MAFAAGGRLAAAVSRGGGLGLIGGGYGDRDWIDAQFDQAGDADVGCGFITWALAKIAGSARPRARASPARAHALLRRPAPASPPKIRDGGRAVALPGPDAGGRRARARGGRRRRRRAGRARPVATATAARRSPSCPRWPICIAARRRRNAALRGGRHRRRPGRRGSADPRGRRRRRRIAALGDGGGEVSERMRDAALAADGDATIRTSVVDIARSSSTGPSASRPASCATGSPTSGTGTRPSCAGPAGTRRREWREGWAAGDPDRSSTFIGEAVGLIETIEPAAEVIERMSAQAAGLLRRG